MYEPHIWWSWARRTRACLKHGTHTISSRHLPTADERQQASSSATVAWIVFVEAARVASGKSSRVAYCSAVCVHVCLCVVLWVPPSSSSPNVLLQCALYTDRIPIIPTNRYGPCMLAIYVMVLTCVCSTTWNDMGMKQASLLLAHGLSKATNTHTTKKAVGRTCASFTPQSRLYRFGCCIVATAAATSKPSRARVSNG